MNARHDYAFLAELTAAALFFALAATVILTLFAGAQKRADEAARLSGAVLAASSAAELVRTSASPGADFMAAYGAAPENGGYEAFLDPSFLPSERMEYVLRLECSEENGLCRMRVAVMFPDGEEIYSLSCASYAGGEA